ncbi:MAG: hypothetical protein AAF468_21255 [Pseudomonadota bacterium]
MLDQKPWYQSKTIWGSLVSVAAGIAAGFQIEIDMATQEVLSNALFQLVSAGGALLAVYGRIVAASRIV